METTKTINPNKALWKKGYATQILATMVAIGERLVSQFNVQKGMKVLDVGCGGATPAIPMASLAQALVCYTRQKD